jgi:hypothetical protein
MFENRVLRRVFERKGEEVIGGVRKLHKQGIRDLYSASHIIRVKKEREMRRAVHGVQMGEKSSAWRSYGGEEQCMAFIWGRRAVHGVHMGEKKNAHRSIVGKPESQNSLGRSLQR